MKNERRLPIILWALLSLPLITTLVVFPRLPENIPMHWNVNGQIDTYLPKFPGAFFIPLLCIVFLFSFIPSIPKERFEKSRNAYYKMAGVLTALFLLLHFTTIAISMGADFIRVDYLIKFAIGILFMFVGNLMPKLKVEEQMLKKRPWMAKAQRHLGYAWCITGTIFVALAFIPGIISGVIYISLAVISSFEPMIYAYLNYGKGNKSRKAI